jgi:TolB protein
MKAFAILIGLVACGSLLGAAPAHPGTPGGLVADALPEVDADRPCAEADVPFACQKIAFVSDRDGNAEIYSVGVDGAGLVRLTNAPESNDEPAWSPDGRRIAFVSARSGAEEIYVMDADGSNVVRRTFSGWYSGSPAWSPDGSKIAYSSLSRGSVNLWVMGADAGGPPPTLLFSAPGWDGQPAWSPDGTHLALVSDWAAYDCVWDIYLVNADGYAFTALTGNIFDQIDYLRPSWSPDGTRIAVDITERVGTYDYISTLGVMDPDGMGLTPLIPAVMNTTISWSPDGRRIAFTSGSGGTRDISWVEADGSASGLIVSGGWNPSWRR